MNLRALDTPLMLALAEGWLNDADLRDEVTAHPLGAAAFDHLDDMTRHLSRQSRQCDCIAADVVRMGQELQALSTCYSRKARAFHNHLDALADAASDPDRAEQYRELKQFFFPRGLSITKRSYMEMSGVIVELEHSVTQDMMAQLEEVRVGEYTLAELFQDWAAAGHAIGELTLERMHLQASISKGHTLAARAGKMHLRNKWIRALRLLMGVMDELPLAPETREQFHAPLAKVVRGQQRRTGNGTSDHAVDTDATVEISADSRPWASTGAGRGVDTDATVEISADAVAMAAAPATESVVNPGAAARPTVATVAAGTGLASAAVEHLSEPPARSESRIDEPAMEQVDELLAERIDESFMSIGAVPVANQAFIQANHDHDRADLTYLEDARTRRVHGGNRSSPIIPLLEPYATDSLEPYATDSPDDFPSG